MTLNPFVVATEKTPVTSPRTRSPEAASARSSMKRPAPFPCSRQIFSRTSAPSISPPRCATRARRTEFRRRPLRRKRPADRPRLPELSRARPRSTVARNYFAWNLPTDTYNIDRVEDSRGPTPCCSASRTRSLINVMTKKAQPQRSFRVVSLGTAVAIRTAWRSTSTRSSCATRSRFGSTPCTIAATAFAIACSPRAGCRPHGDVPGLLPRAVHRRGRVRPAREQFAAHLHALRFLPALERQRTPDVCHAGRQRRRGRRP